MTIIFVLSLIIKIICYRHRYDFQKFRVNVRRAVTGYCKFSPRAVNSAKKKKLSKFGWFGSAQKNVQIKLFRVVIRWFYLILIITNFLFCMYYVEQFFFRVI